MVKVLSLVCFSMFIAMGAQAKSSQSETAQAPFEMGEPKYSGSGCAQGTMTSTLTEDKKSLSLLFDEFVVEAGANKKKTTKNCNVVVPVKVPRGWQVAIVNTDQRGFYSVPQKGQVEFQSKYYLTTANNKFRLSQIVSKKVVVKGENEEDYTFTSSISPLTLWSLCGADVNFHIEKRVMASTNKQGDDVIATIDSIDNTIGKKSKGFELLWRHCK